MLLYGGCKNAGFSGIRLDNVVLVWIIASAAASSQILAGQTDSAAAEIGRLTDAEMHRLINQGFTSCKDNPESTYFGPLGLPVLACGFGQVFSGTGYRPPATCSAVFEYQNYSFALNPPPDKADLSLSLADRANHIGYRGYLTLNYSLSRVRHIRDGVWGPWEDWLNKSVNVDGNPGPYKIFLLEYRNGKWSEEVGPDFLNVPFVSVKNIMPSQKPSCDQLLDRPTNAATGRKFYARGSAEYQAYLAKGAPGHSMSDTYERTLEIEKENKDRGIPDGMGVEDTTFILPVCFSISARGDCERTSETVRVPGDLEEPLDWAKIERPGYCNSSQPIFGEVVIPKKRSQDQRKRFLRCGDARRLASVRKDMLELGVKE